MTEGPIVQLECCICGKPFRGRQHTNRDKGYGLGDCCVTFAKRTTPACNDFEKTFGKEGVHFNVQMR